MILHQEAVWRNATRAYILSSMSSFLFSLALPSYFRLTCLSPLFSLNAHLFSLSLVFLSLGLWSLRLFCFCSVISFCLSAFCSGSFFSSLLELSISLVALVRPFYVTSVYLLVLVEPRSIGFTNHLVYCKAPALTTHFLCL